MAAQENVATGMLDVSVTYTFQEDINADWRVACVLTEDGVTGNSNNLTLSPTSSFIKLDGIQLSGVNELTIGGDLDLAGNLDQADAVYCRIRSSIDSWIQQ